MHHPEKVWPEWFEEIRGDLVPVWLLTLLVAVGGVYLGLRFVRGNRHLLLFLRRFGFSPATQTVTEATTQLGDFWRVVTLDDDSIESLGSGEAVEGLVDVVTRRQAVVPVGTTDGDQGVEAGDARGRRGARDLAWSSSSDPPLTGTRGSIGWRSSPTSARIPTAAGCSPPASPPWSSSRA